MVIGEGDEDAVLVGRGIFEVELSTAVATLDRLCDGKLSLTTTTVLKSTANTPNTFMPAALTTSTSKTSRRSHCDKIEFVIEHSTKCAAFIMNCYSAKSERSVL